MARRRSGFVRRGLRLWFLLFCFVIFVLIERVRLLQIAGRALVENDGPHNAQAAVVLGGDEFGNRILKAAELARKGFVPVVLVSGPPYLDEHECDFTIPFAERRGFPGSMFRAFPHQADSTRSESKLLSEYLRNHSVSSVMLITSNYHTRRAAFLVRQAAPALEVYVVPAPDPNFDPESWWRTRNGQKTFLNEWAKTIATRLGD